MTQEKDDSYIKEQKELRRKLLNLIAQCEQEKLQEEDKQNTLEESAENWVKNRFAKQICGDESYPDIYASKEAIVQSHIIFAKWQQEQETIPLQKTLKEVEENIDREEWINFFKNNSKEEILEYLINYKFPL